MPAAKGGLICQNFNPGAVLGELWGGVGMDDKFGSSVSRL